MSAAGAKVADALIAVETSLRSEENSNPSVVRVALSITDVSGVAWWRTVNP